MGSGNKVECRLAFCLPAHGAGASEYLKPEDARIGPPEAAGQAPSSSGADPLAWSAPRRRFRFPLLLS
jgi:hypothetical protein